MNLLVDTHVFLWYIAADSRLPRTFRTAMESADNQVFLSVVSIWESVIQFQLGKLTLPAPPSGFLARQRAMHGITSLVIDEETIAILESLPSYHRDPFDRMLIAQAVRHSLTIVTVDREFHAYSAAILPIG